MPEDLQNRNVKKPKKPGKHQPKGRIPLEFERAVKELQAVKPGKKKSK
jgi:hypothetical protein